MFLHIVFENLDVTLEVLEYKLPIFFKGVKRVSIVIVNICQYICETEVKVFYIHASFIAVNMVLSIFQIYTQIYSTSNMTQDYPNGNWMKIPLSEDTFRQIERNFSMEIEFYEFCKRRLFKQRSVFL